MSRESNAFAAMLSKGTVSLAGDSDIGAAQGTQVMHLRLSCTPEPVLALGLC